VETKVKRLREDLLPLHTLPAKARPNLFGID
jgi:hypothetical protein